MTHVPSVSNAGHVVFNKRKEVIRCLMVQQVARVISFGSCAAKAKSLVAHGLPGLRYVSGR
jgi:hypothetical protein